VQLQIIPTTIGFFALVDGEAAAGAELLEPLDPQALRQIEAATTAQDAIAARRERR
jgi:hypothetical protein